MSEMRVDSDPKAAIISDLRQEVAALGQYPDPKLAEIILKKAEVLELQVPDGKWFTASWSDPTKGMEKKARTVRHGTPKTIRGAKEGYGLHDVSLSSLSNRPYIDRSYNFVHGKLDLDLSKSQLEQVAGLDVAFNQALFDEVGTYYVDHDSARVYASAPMISGFSCIAAPSRNTAIESLKEAGYTQSQEPLFGMLSGNQIPVEPIPETSRQPRMWTEDRQWKEVEEYWNSLPDPTILAALSGVAISAYSYEERF